MAATLNASILRPYPTHSDSCPFTLLVPVHIKTIPHVHVVKSHQLSDKGTKRLQILEKIRHYWCSFLCSVQLCNGLYGSEFTLVSRVPRQSGVWEQDLSNPPRPIPRFTIQIPSCNKTPAINLQLWGCRIFSFTNLAAALSLRNICIIYSRNYNTTVILTL